jgi:hypothetical protein
VDMSARRRSAPAVLAFLLASFTAVVSVSEGALFHTDDGCRVEVHCVACRWAAGATSVATPATPAAAQAIVFAGLVAPRSEGFRPLSLSSSTTSRGPPSRG